MPYKNSVLFAATTNPTDTVAASAHSGGWSENFWSQSPVDYASAPVLAWLNRRRVMLPRGASIIGWRRENYTISGNKLLPGQSSTGSLNMPGSGVSMDLPQCSLSVRIASGNLLSASRYILACIWDSVISNGEYQPDAAFNTAFNNWKFDFITAQLYGWVGRDKAFAASRVLAVVGDVLTTDVAIAGVAVGDFVIFKRTVTDVGLPLTGSYRVTAIAGTNYTLAGLPDFEVTTPSGTVRKDALTFYLYGAVGAPRAVPRKIGRPSQAYRGRRSRTRR